MPVTGAAAHLDTGGPPSRAARQRQALAHLLVIATCATAWLPLSVQVAGLNIRVSQLVLPIALLALVRPAWRPRISRTGLVMGTAGVLFLGALAAWTVVQSPEGVLLQPLAKVLLHGINALHLVAIYLLARRTGTAVDLVPTFGRTVAALNAFFVGLLVLTQLGVAVPAGVVGVAPQPVIGADGRITSDVVPRIEAGGVVGGCISTAALLALLGLAMGGRRHRPRDLLAVTGMAGVGIVVGFSRQALVSLALGLLFILTVLVLRGRFRRVGRVMVRVGALVAVVTLLVAVVPGVWPVFRAFAGRALLLFDERAYGVGTVRDRWSMWGGMLSDVARNPLVGQGQEAYMKWFPSDMGGGSHNLAIEVLHAGGLGAFLPLLILHAIPLGRATRVLLRGRRGTVTEWPLLGLTAAAIGLVSASMTNLIFWNPTYWLLLGWLLALATPHGAATPAMAPAAPVLARTEVRDPPAPSPAG